MAFVKARIRDSTKEGPEWGIKSVILLRIQRCLLL